MADHSWGNGRFSSSSGSGGSMGPLSQNSGWGSGNSWAPDSDNLIGELIFWGIIFLVALPFVAIYLVCWLIYKGIMLSWNWYQETREVKASQVSTDEEYVEPPRPNVTLRQIQDQIPVVAKSPVRPAPVATPETSNIVSIQSARSVQSLPRPTVSSATARMSRTGDAVRDDIRDCIDELSELGF